MPDVLILTQDAAESQVMSKWLEGRFSLNVVETPQDAEALLNIQPARVMLCSDELEGESGLMFVARTRNLWPQTRRILMATNLDGSLFFHTMKEVDLFSYLRRPFDRDELFRIVNRALNEPARSGPLTAGFGSTPTQKFEGTWKYHLLTGTGLVVGAIILLIVLFAGAYILKSAAGIDFFPDWHLRDLLKN